MSNLTALQQLCSDGLESTKKDVKASILLAADVIYHAYPIASLLDSLEYLADARTVRSSDRRSVGKDVMLGCLAVAVHDAIADNVFGMDSS